MADKKITQLTELTSVDDADLLAIVDDPSGTPETKKITRANLLDGYLANLVDDTTPQLGGDLDLNGHNLDFPTTTNISDCLDEDTMVSDSATKICTQQSIKAYVDGRTPAASTTVSGIIEVATAAETTTGTDETRAVSPDGLAGSDYGKRIIGILVFDDSSSVSTGDGAGDIFVRIPSIMSGWNLVAVAACDQTAATGTGTEKTTIQIHNVTQAADMLTTELSIDEDETDSSTAATPAVIDTNNDDVATGDQIRIDVDGVPSTTPGNGLYVELTFQLP